MPNLHLPRSAQQMLWIFANFHYVTKYLASKYIVPCHLELLHAHNGEHCCSFETIEILAKSLQLRLTSISIHSYLQRNQKETLIEQIILSTHGLIKKSLPIFTSSTNTSVRAMSTATIHVSVVKKHAFQLILVHAHPNFSHDLVRKKNSNHDKEKKTFKVWNISKDLIRISPKSRFRSAESSSNSEITDPFLRCFLSLDVHKVRMTCRICVKSTFISYNMYMMYGLHIWAMEHFHRNLPRHELQSWYHWQTG